MATELKKKRKVKVVHVLLGIIALVVLIPVFFFVYVLVIDPIILSGKAVRSTYGYIEALSEQDYERAADYILIREQVDDYNYVDGDREAWIERMEQLEESGITIKGIQNVSQYTNDGCMMGVYFDVVIINANGDERTFDGRTIPIPSCGGSAFQYEGLIVTYHPRSSGYKQARLAISSTFFME